jgi:hypothetical protein
LAQWREYRLAMARSGEERQVVDAEYAQPLQDGLNVTRYRVGSIAAACACSVRTVSNALA